MIARAVACALLLAALPACGEVEAVESAPRADARFAVELPNEAELLERARREIGPEDFEAELQRLRGELLGAAGR